MDSVLNRRKWIKLEGEGDTLAEKILDIRGIDDRDFFLNGTVDDFHDITLLNNGVRARDILEKKIKENKKIVIHTDYDTDGASGGSVAYLMLKELGSNASYYANNRFVDGYGICINAVDNILGKYPDVDTILTIDNGISAHEAIDYAKSKGLTVIVTDHHEQGKELPRADAVVNPKRLDSTYPFDGLCGAAVVWKVLRELYEDKKEANKYLDILAISTVGDVVPLVDENRIIVKEGLRLLNNESRKSLAILKEMTDTAVVTAGFTLGFIYSPIFNAGSRLNGEIIPVIDMLVSEDEKEIREITEKLIELNEERKRETEIEMEIARELLEAKGVREVIVLYSENFKEGIVGLIAGRLKEEYNRPVFVLTNSDDGSFVKGSARSIREFHIKKTLGKCEDLLLGYGGHAMAGGLSLKKENLEKLEEKLIEISKLTLTIDDYVKKYYYIDKVSASDISFDLVDELNELEPYGEGFEKPLIMLEGFNVNRVFTMGEEKNHLKLVGDNLSLIAWREVEHYKKRGMPLTVTALGHPEINVWNNNANLQFMIAGDNFG